MSSKPERSIRASERFVMRRIDRPRTDHGVEPMEKSQPRATSASFRATLIKQFVEHWGLMARTWGINSTMGELFALLYITGTDWTADDLRNWLGVSRGNVSMNLRELLLLGRRPQGPPRRRAPRAVPRGDRRLDPLPQDPCANASDASWTRACVCSIARSISPRNIPACKISKGRIESLRQFLQADRCTGRPAPLHAVGRPGRNQPPGLRSRLSRRASREESRN